jgi:hypothetical protein
MNAAFNNRYGQKLQGNSGSGDLKRFAEEKGQSSRMGRITLEFYVRGKQPLAGHLE